MSKYLVLKFENARVIHTHKDTKDYIFSPLLEGGKIDRKEVEHFVEKGLTVFQISNVLHVLFGERPVPSLRPVLYKRNEYYFNMAEKSYLLYDNKAKVYEFFKTKKAVYNSYNKVSYMYWDRIRRLSENNYDDIIDMLSVATSLKPLDYSFNDFKMIVREMYIENPSRFDKCFTYIKSLMKTPIITSLLGDIVGRDEGSINKNDNTALTLNNGIDKAMVFGGKIVVPISDTDLDYLRKYSKGACTILEGGLVEIVEILDSECDILPSFEDYIHVGSINRDRESKKDIR